MSEARQNEAAADDKNVVFGSVPERLLVCIEHPGIVKNNQNAINTLGGDHIVNRVRRKGLKEGSLEYLTITSCLSQRIEEDRLAYHGDQMIL